MRIETDIPASFSLPATRPVAPASGDEFAAALRQAAKRGRSETAATATKPAAETASQSQRKKAEATRVAHEALTRELRDYLNKTPAEHLREAVLKELGLTEEALAAMPPEERQAAEAKISERIRERLIGEEENKEAANAAGAAVPLGLDDTPGAADADPRRGFDQDVAIFRSINAGRIPT